MKKAIVGPPLPRGITVVNYAQGKFRVRIYDAGTPLHGGYFDDLNEALAKVKELRGERPPDPTQALIRKFLTSRWDPSLITC